MYRLILSGYTDSISACEALRDRYPCRFANGKHKDASVVYAWRDPDYQDGYGAAQPFPELADAQIQLPPSRDIIAKHLPAYAKESPVTIPVRLRSGITLHIAPALCEPRAVLFGSGTFGEPATEYGVRGMAYTELHTTLPEGETYDIAAWLDLAQLALQASYDLPIGFWDASALISVVDLEPLLFASIGADTSFV